MSLTNRRSDRDTNGKLIRRYKMKGTKRGSRLAFSTPGWWVNLHMRRPQRRIEAALCRDVEMGRDPEGIAWPLGSRKPHEYYW